MRSKTSAQDSKKSSSDSVKKIQLNGLSLTIAKKMSLQPKNSFCGMDFVRAELGVFKKGSVYTTLQRMEAKGWLISRQEPPNGMGPSHILRRLYQLTTLAISEVEAKKAKPASPVLAIDASVGHGK